MHFKLTSLLLHSRAKILPLKPQISEIVTAKSISSVFTDDCMFHSFRRMINGLLPKIQFSWVKGFKKRFLIVSLSCEQFTKTSIRENSACYFDLQPPSSGLRRASLDRGRGWGCSVPDVDNRARGHMSGAARYQVRHAKHRGSFVRGQVCKGRGHGGSSPTTLPTLSTLVM